MVALCLGASVAAAQEAGDTSPPLPAAEAGTDRGGDGDTTENDAVLHLFVFIDVTPAEGVIVAIAGSEAAITSEHGRAVVKVKDGGDQIVRLTVPRELVPDAPESGSVSVELTGVSLVSGQTVEALVTLGSDGALRAVDVEGAETADALRAEQRGEDAAPVLAKGTIRGVVRALENKQPIFGAKVYVRGTPGEASTDSEGRFDLELPEGQWDLSVIHTDYSTESRAGVKVLSDSATELDVELAPASVTLDDFVIVVPHIEGSIAAAMDERRESASLTDSITAEDISKTGAGDAAGAAQRVVGVTIVDGRFVYVRGLGERYTNALINGATLPSPEPDRATVPLDLFPTQTIRSIDIVKTFTPDVPADFAGGSVRIETITVPERFVLTASIKGAYNSQSTFRPRPSYSGSSTDWLGFDAGDRGLPSEIPRDRSLGSPSSEEMAAYGPLFTNPMGTTRATTPINYGGSLLIGNGWDIGAGSRLGAIAALTYSRKFIVREEIIREFAVAGADTERELDTRIEARGPVARDSVRWGAFGSVGLELGKNHQLSLTGFRTQLADNTTQVLQGFQQNNDATVAGTRFDFMSRAMEFGQLRGIHDFPALNDANLDWRLSLARATLDQPDLRDVVYFRSQGLTDFVFTGGPGAAQHFYADMDEKAHAAFVDWSQPIALGELSKKIKFGGAFNGKDRIFNARRFTFRRRSRLPPETWTCGPEFDSERCPNELFIPENQDGSVLELQENTGARDAYAATTDIIAGYLMADANVTSSLRVIGGARVESTDMRVDQYNQFSRERVGEDPAHIQSVDLLPSLSASYGFGEAVELRGALSRTLARPQLREIAPFSFYDYYGGATTSGNRDLELTYILNADLRLDVFPSARELISVSIFAKDFDRPIEPIFIPGTSGSQRTFQNAEGAFLYGAEIEARKSLDFVHNALEEVSILANLTLAASQIRVEQTGGDASGVGFITNTERPMVNQAPYVVNLALDYGGEKTQARIQYNVTGRRIVTVGTNGLDDAYLQPQHQLDVNFSRHVLEGILLGVTVENILNAQYLVTQGPQRREDRAVRSYRNGAIFGVSAGYSY